MASDGILVKQNWPFYIRYNTCQCGQSFKSIIYEYDTVGTLSY